MRFAIHPFFGEWTAISLKAGGEARISGRVPSTPFLFAGRESGIAADAWVYPSGGEPCTVFLWEDGLEGVMSCHIFTGRICGILVHMIRRMQIFGLSVAYDSGQKKWMKAGDYPVYFG